MIFTPFSAETHGVLDRAFHRPAERPAALKLARNVFSNQSRIKLWLANFNQVHTNFVIRQFCKLTTQVLNVCPLLTDDQTWTRGMNSNKAFLVRTLDDDPGDTGLTKTLFNMLLNGEVFVQKTAKVSAVRIPAAVSRSG